MQRLVLIVFWPRLRLRARALIEHSQIVWGCQRKGIEVVCSCIQVVCCCLLALARVVKTACELPRNCCRRLGSSSSHLTSCSHLSKSSSTRLHLVPCRLPVPPPPPASAYNQCS